METKREIYVDSAKGVAVILVLMAHSCGFIFGESLMFSYFMPLFFILSGITFRKGGCIKRDIIKREKRLLTAYFAYSTVCIAVECIKDLIKNRFLIKDFFSSVGGMFYSRAYLLPGGTQVEGNVFFKTGGQFPLWFFTSMAVAMPIFIFCIYILEKGIGAKNTKIAFLSVSLIFISLTGLLSYLPVLLPWSIDMALFSAFFMMAGYALQKSDFIFKLSNKKIWIVLAGLIFIYVPVYYFDPVNNYSTRILGEYGFFSAFTFAAQGIFGSLIVIIICKLSENSFPGKILSRVGRHSVIIYGLHLVCFSIIDTIFYKMGIPPTIFGEVRVVDVFKIGFTVLVLVLTETVLSKIIKKQAKLIVKQA